MVSKPYLQRSLREPSGPGQLPKRLQHGVYAEHSNRPDCQANAVRVGSQLLQFHWTSGIALLARFEWYPRDETRLISNLLDANGGGDGVLDVGLHDPHSAGARGDGEPPLRCRRIIAGRITDGAAPVVAEGGLPDTARAPMVAPVARAAAAPKALPA
eukprot:909641-Amphidinium_carterae.1